MKRTTLRTSGADLRRFLHRHLSAQADIDTATAKVAADSIGDVITVARVRKRSFGDAFAALRRRATPTRPTTRYGAEADSATAPSPDTAMVTDTATKTATGTGRETSTPPEQSIEAFDPYAVALVPTFQKSGSDALAAQLSKIASASDLKQMARAQQIGLPAAIRRGDPDPEDVRAAILVAVEKRIADRRAAAR
ncbi:MAG: hypothetical protein AAFR55_00970 [Pseudomonadota bacterium]